MNVIWAKPQASATATSRHQQVVQQFVVWDFFKMLMGAVLCGLAVSVAAAGLTLLLAGSAEARATAPAAPQPSVALDPLQPIAGPGALLLSEGCDAVALAAIERDWVVRIHPARIEVRVMQTFQLPEDSDGVALFQVQLAPGARLRRLAVQTGSQDWEGRLMTDSAYQRLTPAQYRAATQSRLLVAQSEQGAITTSPLLGLKPGDAVTVHYTYEVANTAGEHKAEISLPLAGADDPHLMPSVAVDAEPAARAPLATSGTVWVEWISHQPRHIVAMPGNADVERESSGVRGLSWTSLDLQPGARFQLAWLK